MPAGALGLTSSAMLGESFSGVYVEATYDLLTELAPGSRFAVAPYARYERLDTQDDVPAAGAKDPANERTIVTAGLAVKPHPNVVVKADRQLRSNKSDTGTHQWNVALGYLF